MRRMHPSFDKVKGAAEELIGFKPGKEEARRTSEEKGTRSIHKPTDENDGRSRGRRGAANADEIGRPSRNRYSLP